MAHPLDGIHLKIVRALDDLQTLYDEGTKFLGDDPYRVRFEHYMDKRSGEHRIRALLVIVRQPPMNLGLIAGEAIYHARGSLDHIVYQLALLNRPRPQGTQFPLALDETVYRTAPPGKKCPRDAMLDGVHEDHRAIVDEFQPYHDGTLAEQNRLYVIGRFANADKHRLIQAGYGRPDMIKVEPHEEGIELDVRFPILTPPVKDGAELFSVRWIDGYDDVPMHYEIRMTLAYGRGFSVPVSRLYIVETVQRIYEIVTAFSERVPEFSGP